jgi:hypothetical protein
VTIREKDDAMRTNSWITCLWGLGLASFVSFACFEERPVFMDVGAAGTTGNALGAAGTGFLAGGAGVSGGGAGVSPGVSGTNGFNPNPGGAGIDGASGTTGIAGTTGISTGVGCAEVGTIFETKNCALTGACHDANGAAANFSLTGLPFTDIEGWRTRLVGKHSNGGGTLASACVNSQQFYLAPGSYPATGLFLNKLRANPSCGDRMPVLGEYLTASEMDCVQRWANQLTGPSCRATCGPGTYCRYTYGSPDGGTQTSGTYACWPLPATCNGVLTCGCIQPGCASCQEQPDHVRCADGA